METENPEVPNPQSDELDLESVILEDPNVQHFYAFAKINLSLEIVGKRPDGFHNLSSVMQTVGLYDTIKISPSEDLQFDCNIPELVDENNLVWKAALRLLELCPANSKRGANIFLEKAIPVAAGLGGGSSDGAATLVALNRLWELRLREEELEEIAAELGSDVPFFIRGGTMLVEGRGDRVNQLPALNRTWVVLLYPELELPANKTGELYRMLDRHDFTNGSVTRTLVNSIKQGEPLSQSLLYNTFERVVYDRFPQIDQFRQAMVDSGAEHVQVSGSGPCLYTMLEFEEDAQTLLERLTNAGYRTYAVPTVQPY